MKTIYNENDLVAKLDDELKYDPLFNQIKQRPTYKSELFEERFIIALEEDIRRLYSIAESGRILGGDKPISPSSLKHYIDHLGDYILPEDVNSKFIRLNYLSIVKLKMIWLLKDELKMSGLLAELGFIGTPVTSGATTMQVAPTPSEKDDLLAYKHMTQLLANLFLERDNTGNWRMKQDISHLLSGQKLLGDDVLQKIDNQTKLIEELESKLENEISKRDELSEEYIKQLKIKDKLIEEFRNNQEENKKELHSEINESLREKLEEQNTKLNDLVNKNRKNAKARQLAEEEWDKQGAFKKMFGNRSEFIRARVEEFVRNLESE